MPRITIVRGPEQLPPETILGHIRGFLFGLLDGFTGQDKKSWRRLWHRLMRLEAGEIAQIEFVIPRNPKFHRKFFSMLTFAFDAWEPDRKRKTYKGRPVEKNFEQFREDVLILAGFSEQTFNLRGEMKVKAKSISFANMDDVEFEQVYSAVVDVILADVLKTYANREELEEVVGRVMGYL